MSEAPTREQQLLIQALDNYSREFGRPSSEVIDAIEAVVLERRAKWFKDQFTNTPTATLTGIVNLSKKAQVLTRGKKTK